MTVTNFRTFRLALIAALLPVSWWTIKNGLTLSLESRSPAALAKIVPNAPAALEVRAAELLARPNGANRAKAAALVRQSLVQRIFSPQPLRLLGATAGGLQYDPRSIPLFLLAERTSRRDVPTQLYLISVDARAKRVEPTLARMDRTLRVSRVGRQQLYPLLSQQLPVPDSRQAIAKLVDDDTIWLPDFLSYVVDTETPPEAVAQLVAAIGGFPVAEGRKTFEKSLLNSLDRRKQYAAMRELLPVLKDMPVNLLASAALTRDSLADDASPLAWQLGDNAAIRVYTAIDPSGKGSLAISMDGGLSGLAARKLIALSPGRYRLKIVQSFDDGIVSAATVSAQPVWTIECVAEAAKAPLLAMAGSAITGDFTVPRSCPMVQISLDVRSPSEATANLTVEAVAIDRIGSGQGTLERAR